MKGACGRPADIELGLSVGIEQEPRLERRRKATQSRRSPPKRRPESSLSLSLRYMLHVRERVLRML